MRQVEASLLIKRRIRDVWKQASSLENWQALSETFAGWGFRFRFAIVAGPKDPPGEGTKIAVTNAGGKPVMKVKLAKWDPPRRIELTVRNDGYMTGYHLLATINLSEIDDEMTNAEISLIVMFHNRLVEITSLVLPVRFMYRRRLQRVLLQLRQMAA